MEVLYPRCAGLDVHKDVVVACARLVQADGQAVQEVESFATTTSALCTLADWLSERACTHVVMEATGTYVRRFTARAIPPAGRAGSEGYLWANDSPGGESPRGQQHVVEAGRAGRRVRPGPARPVCYGESLVACTPVPRDGTRHPSRTTPDATPAGCGRPVDATASLPLAGRCGMTAHKGTNGAPPARSDVARAGKRDALPAARPTGTELP